MFKKFFNWIYTIIDRIRAYIAIRKDAIKVYHTYIHERMKNPDMNTSITEYVNSYNPTPTRFPIGFQISTT